jgi:hypothetical protein
MRRSVLKLLLAAGTAVLALALAGPASALGWRGTVLGKERGRHALVVAGNNALVRTVHVGRSYAIRPGARVAISANRLRAGTFRARGVRYLGRAGRARAVGTVLRARPGGYLLGAGKSVLAIHYRGGRQRSTWSGRPRRGDQVLVRVSISPSGVLVQQSVQTVAQGAELEVVGKLTALTNATPATPGSVTVTVEMPGAPPTTTPFSCAVRVGFPDLSAFLNQVVEMECTLANGQWALTELAIPGQKGVDDDEDEEEEEVEGKVTALTPATATTTGSITVGNVTCTIPIGFDTGGMAVGDQVEMECEGGILEEIEKEDDGD